MPPAPKPPPDVGTQFGRWTVIGGLKYQSYGDGKRHRFVKVQCACGTINWVAITRLTNGYSQSCGCLRKEKHTSFMKWRAPLPTSFEA